MHCIFQGQYFLRYLCLTMPFTFCYIESLFQDLLKGEVSKKNVLVFWFCNYVLMFICLFILGLSFEENLMWKIVFCICLFVFCIGYFFLLWNPFDKKIKLFYFFSGNISYLRQGHYFHEALQSNKDAKITKLKKSSFPWSWWAAPKTNDFWMQTSTFQDIYSIFF